MSLSTQIRARVDVPQFVEFSTGTVTIPVRCELENSAENEFAVTAMSEDEAIFWHVLNDQHREIARKPKSGVGGPEAIHSVTVATAHPSHEVFEVAVDAKKLRNGRRFTVRVESYGQTAEGDFVAVLVPSLDELRAAEARENKKAGRKKAKKKRSRKTKRTTAKKVTKKAARKIAKKKAAKKQSTRRKTAKKKTAKKKTAKRKAVKKKVVKKKVVKKKTARKASRKKSPRKAGKKRA